MKILLQIFAVAITITFVTADGLGIGSPKNTRDSAYGADKTTKVFPSTDLPVIVPQNLTQKEYYELAHEYGWSRPKQALECIALIEKQNPTTPLAIEARRWKDTVLPKLEPPNEAVELALKVQTTWQDHAQYIAAKKYADQCIAKYPNFEYSYIASANLEAGAGNSDLAVQAYRRALQINPHNVQAWDGLGDQLLNIHQVSEAKSAFQTSISYDPKDWLARNRLDRMPEFEQSPLSMIGSLLSEAASMITLPLSAAIMARDQEELKTSGYIDKKGVFAFHKLNSGPIRHFSDGLLVSWDHFVDKQANNLCDETFSAAQDFSEGLAAVYADGAWRYLSKSGKFAIPLQLQAAKPFHEGLAPAKIKGHWGFLDKLGKWAVPPKFDGALPFSDGLAAVLLGDKIGYIDHQGKLIIPPQFDAAHSFSDGIALVTSYETAIFRHHERCIDKTGKLVFDLTALKRKTENTQYQGPPTGRISDRSWQRDLLVTRIGQFEGNPGFTGVQYDDPQRFSEGLMLIKCGTMFGYVDKTGSLAIPCKFTSASPFREGVACVSLDPPNLNTGDNKNNQLFGYIGKTGDFLIQPRFLSGADFHEGMAFVREKLNAGYIDHTGQIRIKVQSKNGQDFHDGLAEVGTPVVYP